MGETIHRLLGATEELQVVPPSDSPFPFLLITGVFHVLVVGRAQDGRASLLSWWALRTAPRLQMPSRAVDVGRQTESKFQLAVQQTRQNPLSASPTPDLPTSTQVGRHHRIASRTPGLPLFSPLSSSTQPLPRVHPVPRRQRPTDHSLFPPKACSPNRRLARLTPPRRSIRRLPAPPTTHPLRPPPCRQNSGAGSSSTTSQMAETAGGSA